MKLARMKTASWIGVLLVVGSFVACNVTVDPGAGTVTVANRTFRVPLGVLGVFEILADGAPAKTEVEVKQLFTGTPAEEPGTAVVALNQSDVTVTPLGTQKGAVAAQTISGTAELEVYIDSQSSNTPCDTGEFIGTFRLSFSNGSVSIESTSLELSPTALIYVLTGSFTMCLQMTATVDVTITIGGLDIDFGPPADEAECVSDSDCAGGEVCINGECQPSTTAECVFNSDCDTGEICVNGECVLDTTPECTVDSDCATGETCVDGECVPETEPECTTDADCADGEVCVDGECVPETVPECTTDTDCATGEVCTDGECVPETTPECTTDADCAEGEVCTDGECVPETTPECTTNADCADGEVCMEGECVPETTPECTTDADCAAGEVCTDGECVEEGTFPAEIEYRQTMTVLVKVEDVDDYLIEHPHGCGTPVVSADGSTVAFKSWVDGWRVPDSTDNVHTYVINADGTGLTDLNSAMPTEMLPDTVGLLLLNDDGSRLFAKYQANIYYINLPSGTWTLAVAEQDSLGNMGGHKPYMINGAGTRMYFLEDEGWNDVTEKYDRGIYYADLGGAPVSLMDLAELPEPTATAMNMIGLKGNAADGTILFTWNEDYYAGDSIGLWKVGPSGGATRVDSTTRYYMYSVQDLPNKIVSADAGLALYHWGTSDSEFELDLIDMSTGAVTTLATDTGINNLGDIALSGNGQYARYLMPDIRCALHNLQTGDRRETMSTYTSLTTWATELSDLTYDGRYQFQTDSEYAKIYRTDFQPGEGPYAAAPSVSAITFSAEELPNDGTTTITATATVSDPQGLSTIEDVNWLPLIDGREDIGGGSPLRADWYWMYDDGTHGDEVADDGVFTQNTILTTTGSSVYDEITLPYDFGFRVLVTDEDGNHTIADTTLTVVAP